MDELEGSWSYAEDLQSALINSDAVVILTEWDDYLKINWKEISKIMRKPSWIFDTRGIIDDNKLIGSDLNFWKVGKGFVNRK